MKTLVQMKQNLSFYIAVPFLFAVVAMNDHCLRKIEAKYRI